MLFHIKSALDDFKSPLERLVSSTLNNEAQIPGRNNLATLLTGLDPIYRMISHPGIVGERQSAGAASQHNRFINTTAALPHQQVRIMMRKKILLFFATVLLMAAAADPLEVFAEGDPLASPTPQPTQRIAVPVTRGINPRVILPEGDLGDITPSGGPISQEPLLIGAVDPPPFVELQPVELEGESDIPAEDVSCGPAALAGAMDLIRRQDDQLGPDASELETFLRDRGLMYSWGTGVEELVYAARNFGFPGTRAEHDWGLEDLFQELEHGNPLVVPLGLNGPDQPGHFLLLTGFSQDKEWIYCTDPQQGKFRLSREEFTSLWGLQGRAAVVLAKTPFSDQADPMLPWMGLLSSISVLGLVLAQRGELGQVDWYRKVRSMLSNPLRKGIGGGIRLQADNYSKAIQGVIPGVIPPKGQTTTVEVPIYEFRRVQVGTRQVKRIVPVYETRRVLAGIKREVREIPTYKWARVYCGTRLVEKRVTETRFRIKKVWVLKKVTAPKPVTFRIGSKEITLWKNQASWKWVQIDKKVPYQVTKIIKVSEPVYKFKRVQSGTRSVTRWVPRYEMKRIQTGSKTIEETVPVYGVRKVKVGTRLVTVPISPDPVKAGPPDQKNDEEEDQTQQSVLVRQNTPLYDPASNLQEMIDQQISMPDESGPAESWLYKTILFFQNVKASIGRAAEKLGAPRQIEDPPHLFSLSTHVESPLNLRSEEGILVNSYKPPHFLDLFYTKQAIEIAPKVVATIHPDGLMDLNLTSKTWSMKFGNTTLFSSYDGAFGFAYKLEQDETKYNYKQSKYLFRSNSDGFSFIHKIEGVVFDKIMSNENTEYKEINTLKCQITTFRTLGVLVGVLAVVLLAALIYFCLSRGIPLPLPA